ncbi:ThiF family protein [Tritrichomonas foetus]|uniref:NEDD8-activating enzyme E1 regulatory subunit n=1 Tax=Tritrichomonas foetus TaxID=1144522 RepID=A0A1J4KV19_9EUKA|nr:ThiF family protein [Tritrichomonas foetus]|eukprot:OHT15161.1 ThiF family protein [Tritrichomonas foetus]
MTDNERYDRQIRLWGPHGQAAIQASTILFAGSDSTASEFLKNMVLHGVNNVIIVDDAIVTEKDLGSNFFVDADSLGKNRAETVASLLTELNPSSNITAIVAKPNDLAFLDNEKLDSNSFVLTSGNLKPSFLSELSDKCREKHIRHAHIQTSGYFGAFYVDGGLHHFFEGSAQSQYPLEELRILNPFPELVEFFDSLDFDKLDDAEHSHIVFPAILHRVRTSLLKELNVETLTSKNSVDVRAKIDSFRRLKKDPEPNADPFMDEPGIDEAHDNIFLIYGKPRLPLLAEECFMVSDMIGEVDEPFWQLVRATQRFYKKYAALPHYGGCPDMEASSAQYRKLKHVYLEKSEKDWAEISEDLKSRNVQIDEETFDRFRRNVWKIGGIQYKPLKETLEKLPDEYCLYDDASIRLGIVQHLFIAVRRFIENNNRPPSNTEEDFSFLLAEIEKLKDKNVEQQLPEQFIIEREKFVREFCRYKGEVLPSVVASFAAMLAQEITKLIIKQANPVKGIVLYDAIHGLLNVAD